MPIEFRCPLCGKGFKVDEKHVGRKTICKGCGTTILVPQPGETEAIVIPNEDEVLLPATAAEPSKRVIERDGQLFAAISKHVEQHIGAIARVFRDHVNEKKQVDILWVKPTAKTPFHTLATCGMAEHPMQVPPEDNGFPYAEIILCLPQNWPIDESALANEAIYWPLRWMKLVARLPHEQNSYVARSQVLPNGVPARPFHNNTKMTAWMFTPPLIGSEELPAMSLPDRTVDFFAMTAIHTDELRFYYQHGYLETFRRMKEEFPVRTLYSLRRPSFLQPHQ